MNKLGRVQKYLHELSIVHLTSDCISRDGVPLGSHFGGVLRCTSDVDKLGSSQEEQERRERISHVFGLYNGRVSRGRLRIDLAPKLTLHVRAI